MTFYAFYICWLFIRAFLAGACNVLSFGDVGLLNVLGCFGVLCSGRGTGIIMFYLEGSGSCPRGNEFLQFWFQWL